MYLKISPNGMLHDTKEPEYNEGSVSAVEYTVREYGNRSWEVSL